MLAFQNRQAEVMRMWNTIWEQAFYTKCKEISMESAQRHVRSMTSSAGRSSKGSALHHKKPPSVVSQVSVHYNSMIPTHPFNPEEVAAHSTYQCHKSSASMIPLWRATLTDKPKGCLLKVVLQISAGSYRSTGWLFNYQLRVLSLLYRKESCYFFLVTWMLSLESLHKPVEVN